MLWDTVPAGDKRLRSLQGGRWGCPRGFWHSWTSLFWGRRGEFGWCGEWLCHCCKPNHCTKHSLTHPHTQGAGTQGNSNPKRVLELIRAVLQLCLLSSPVLLSSQAPFPCCLGLKSYHSKKKKKTHHLHFGLLRTTLYPRWSNRKEIMNSRENSWVLLINRVKL